MFRSWALNCLISTRVLTLRDMWDEDKAAFFAELMQLRDVVLGHADAGDGGGLAAVAPALRWQ